ncbi:zeaxanthin epoxidase [Pseudohyphozyma bogoriensis]|nr:zeaxanthin epoxidase [Pseudohyphozyma bogoriensis]
MPSLRRDSNWNKREKDEASWSATDGSSEAEDEVDDVVMNRARMSFRAVVYKGLGAKVLHFIYPLLVFAHFPATLFLDYNHLYVLSQLALSPSLPSTSTSSSYFSGLASRSLSLSIPHLNASTAWWVALAVYGLCTFLWAFVVMFWVEFVRGYVRNWGTGKEVKVGRVYRGAMAFNYGCMRDYRYFSLLWRIRLAPFQSRGALNVPGSTWVDGVIETSAWYIQNWPTVLLLIPRAGLSLAILLLYGTTAYGNDVGQQMIRDGGYFQDDGTLTLFASAVLLANLAWAGYRLLIVVLSSLTLLVLQSSTSTTIVIHHHSHTETTSQIPSWRYRRAARIRAAILLCSRSHAASPNPLVVGEGGASPEMDRDGVYAWQTVKDDEGRKMSTTSAVDARRRSSAIAIPVTMEATRRPSAVLAAEEKRDKRNGGTWSFAAQYILPTPSPSRGQSYTSPRQAPPVPKGVTAYSQDHPLPPRAGTTEGEGSTYGTAREDSATPSQARATSRVGQAPEIVIERASPTPRRLEAVRAPGLSRSLSGSGSTSMQRTGSNGSQRIARIPPPPLLPHPIPHRQSSRSTAGTSIAESVASSLSWGLSNVDLDSSPTLTFLESTQLPALQHSPTSLSAALLNASPTFPSSVSNSPAELHSAQFPAAQRTPSDLHLNASFPSPPPPQPHPSSQAPGFLLPAFRLSYGSRDSYRGDDGAEAFEFESDLGDGDVGDLVLTPPPASGNVSEEEGDEFGTPTQAAYLARRGIPKASPGGDTFGGRGRDSGIVWAERQVMGSISSEKLKVIVVGAGIAGLACAPIHLGPNASKIALAWGLDLDAIGSPECVRYREHTGATGEVIVNAPMNPRAAFGAPWLLNHRVDLHNELKRLATAEEIEGAKGGPAEIRSSARVVSTDCTAGTVTLESGEVLSADVIIGADGIHSVTKEAVLGEKHTASPSGHSAYRCLIPAEVLEKEEDLKYLVESESADMTGVLSTWMGEDRRVVAYPCRRFKFLNVVAIIPDTDLKENSTESWSAEGVVSEMVAAFPSFPPVVHKLLSLAPSCGLWQLRDQDPLPTWVNGHVILVGDAAHAMLPHQGQGGGQSIEDAEALGAVLAGLTKADVAQIPERLKLVEKIRMERATKIQGYSRTKALGVQTGNSWTANANEFAGYNFSYPGAIAWAKKQGIELPADLA